MSKCEVFLNYFNYLMEKESEPMPDEVKEFYDILITQKDSIENKPQFTENGFLIFEYMRENNITSTKSKDLSEQMGISSRTISGAMRKLTDDGFVEKFGKSPVVYTMTEKGKNFDIKNYKESLNDV